MSRRPLTLVVGTLAVLIATLSGCIRPTIDDRPRGTSHMSSTTDPRTALTMGGLELPHDAQNATMMSFDLPDRRDAWAITFHAPMTSAKEFAMTSSLEPERDLTEIPSTHRGTLGNAVPRPGTTGYSSVYGTWFRYITVEAGDPAIVRVSLQDMTR